MNVPFADLAREHEPLSHLIVRELEAVLASGRYVLGPRVAAFERAFSEYVGAKHTIGVSSGTDALMLALLALDIGPGDVVVTTAYSFESTASMVRRCGAEVAFVDIDPKTFNMDTGALAEWLESDPRAARTKAILPVHLFGLAADLESIAAITDIPIIEDAAQAIGTLDRGGRHVGALGALGCFSFYPTKNLAAIGDGGAVVTNDDVLAARVRRARSHGGPRDGNHRLDELQAAVLSVKLPLLDAANDRRATHARAYDEALAGHLDTPTPAGSGARHTYHQYVVRSADRDRLRARLADDGVETMVYYPAPLFDLPNAAATARESLALPIRPSLTDEMRDYVIERIIG